MIEMNIQAKRKTKMPDLTINRRALLTKLGGASAIAILPAEALADALEHELMDQAAYGPECSEIDIIKVGRDVRRGAGQIFDKTIVPKLYKMPERPTLIDFFKLRFSEPTVSHCLKSAAHALNEGQPERNIMASLVHDIVINLIKTDHAWWGADLIAPYVDERITWGVRHHQALRFYADTETGYEYPELYRCVFGKDFEPEPYIQNAYSQARAHRWYMEARMITLNDTYGFTPGPAPDIDQFTDIIARNWRQPEQGLGFDDSASAHMWRTLLNPERPL